MANVTEDIAKKLQLRHEGIEWIIVLMFRANKPEEIVRPRVSLTWKTKEGNAVSITSYIVLQISRSIERSPKLLKNQHKIERKYTHLGTFSKRIESCSIGKLIGSDCYNDIMVPETVEIQDDLYVIKSNFGYLSKQHYPMEWFPD